MTRRVYRFADENMRGPCVGGSDIVRMMLDTGEAAAFLYGLLSRAVYGCPAPVSILKDEVCALTPEQLECAASATLDEVLATCDTTGCEVSEVLLPPVLWSLDVPAHRVREWCGQAIVNFGGEEEP